MLLLVTVPIPRRRARAASCITAMPKASMQREVAVAVWGLYDRPCAQEKGRNVRARRAAKLAYTGTSQITVIIIALLQVELFRREFNAIYFSKP